MLSYDELDALIATCEDLEELTFLHVGLFGGLRISEILGLRPGDILYGSYAVRVSAESAKGGKERISPVTPTTISLLRGLAAGLQPYQYIFSRKARAYQTRMEKLSEKAGVRRVNPHMLRHTCATMQLDMGVDLETVRANLGHSSVEITQIYLHLNIRQRRRKYQDAMRTVL